MKLKSNQSTEFGGIGWVQIGPKRMQTKGSSKHHVCTSSKNLCWCVPLWKHYKFNTLALYMSCLTHLNYERLTGTRHVECGTPQTARTKPNPCCDFDVDPRFKENACMLKFCHLWTMILLFLVACLACIFFVAEGSGTDAELTPMMAVNYATLTHQTPPTLRRLTITRILSQDFALSRVSLGAVEADAATKRLVLRWLVGVMVQTDGSPQP